jgi:hypothetical protein
MFTDEEEKYEKQRLRMFWTYRWRYGRIENWMEDLTTDSADYFANAATELYSKELRKRDLDLFKDALIKMIFEKRLTKDEASSLFDMIKSSDKESLFLALTIMQQKKHTIFLKK